MARKESITIDKITQTAFEMAREEGFEAVTARKLAARAGCSTQPIFRVYKNMDELWTAVYEMAVVYFTKFYDVYGQEGDVPFLKIGMAYLAFAKKEKQLFRLLFVSDLKEQIQKKSMYEILNGKNGNIVREVNRAKAEGCKDPGELFMRMWIFIHGAACMTLTGDYDLTTEETRALITRSYQAFLNS